jgi:hypothetical protein
MERPGNDGASIRAEDYAWWAVLDKLINLLMPRGDRRRWFPGGLYVFPNGERLLFLTAISLSELTDPGAARPISSPECGGTAKVTIDD